MSRRYVVQIEARIREGSGDALQSRLNALGIGVIDVTTFGGTVTVDCHLRLSDREHQVDAHQTIKRALGAASLRTRWLDLDEVVWPSEIRDPIRR